MTTYDLYLESGPRRKKTMAHIPRLLGCISTGPTTEDAIAAAPAAILAFQQFLQRHGDPIQPDPAIELRVVEHITEGFWLGNGDATILFAADLPPLTPPELEALIARLEWLRLDITALAGHPLYRPQWDVEPANGRTIRHILEHIIESEYNFIYAYRRIPELPGIGSIIAKQQGDLLDWWAYVRGHEIARFRALTPTQLSDRFTHQKYPYTARKILRRMLEHQWEHLLELHSRLIPA